MKIGLIGHTGRVGKLLVNRKDVVPLECDITRSESIEEAITRVRPDVVASLASKSNVNWCEEDSNFDEMYAVNVVGVNNLGMLSDKYLLPVVIISTDHIFSGRTYFNFRTRLIYKSGPYTETSYAYPVNQYGMTKMGAETLAMSYDNMKVVRTSYLFDRERLEAKLYTAKYPVGQTSYPSFMYRSFMHTEHFVESFYTYLKNVYNMQKLVHISGSLTTSWYDFMKSVYESQGISTKQLKKRKKEIVGLAPRPHKAGLITTLSKKLGLPQFDYYDGLKLL